MSFVNWHNGEMGIRGNIHKRDGLEEQEGCIDVKLDWDGGRNESKDSEASILLINKFP